MFNAIASFLGIHPALLAVILFFGFLMLLTFILKGNGGLKYLFTGDSSIDEAIKELTDFKFIKAMGEIGKKIYEALARKKIEGGGDFAWIIPAIIFISVVVLSVNQLLGLTGFSFKSGPDKVGPRDSCYRSNGNSWDKLNEGDEIQVGDDCNGKIVEPTAIPPTAAPTQTMAAPTPTVVSTEYVVPSPTTAPTQKPQTFIILPIMFDGQITTQYGFQEVGSLGGHHKVEGKDLKCGFDPYLNFEIPQGTKTAFLLYEGDRGDGLFSAEPSISDVIGNGRYFSEGNTFKINLCTPVGGWFSLWVND